MGKKKKGVLSTQPAPKVAKVKKQSAAGSTRKERNGQDERRVRKMQHRMKDRRERLGSASMNAEPLPANLAAKGRLEKPKVNSKYKTYLEFAENTEKKEKKLDFQVCVGDIFTFDLLTPATAYE